MSYKLNEKQLKRVLQLGCEERYEYFLKKVTKWEEIWILVDSNKGFLKICSEEDDLEYIPVWPHPDYAREYASDSDEVLKPKSISLSEFIEKWVPGLDEDALNVGIFPNQDLTVWVIEPFELSEEIEGELSKYQ